MYLYKPCFLVLFILFLPSTLGCIVFGSDTTPSRQASTASFPNTDTNNEMRGFSIFEKGFLLQDYTTRCTYNSLFPVSGNVNLCGGYLYLREDLTFENALNFVSVGFVEGNSRSITLSKSLPTLTIPTGNLTATALGLIDTDAMTASVTTIDWAPSGSYLVAGTANGSTDMVVYYWDGATLTSTLSASWALGNTNSVRWNKAYPLYFAMAKSQTTGNEIRVYRHRVYNGTLTEVSGVSLGTNNGLCVAWHPSGLRLVLGNSNNANELIVYSFTVATEAIASISTTDITSNQDPSPDAIDFAPGGNYLAVGLAASGTNPTLMIYSFNGTTLTLTSSVNTGATVTALDWSPTGTYIAVGMSGTTERLRVYKHDPVGATILEIQTPRAAEATTVNGVAWNSDGTMFASGTSNGASSKVNLYTFDKATESLSLFNSAVQTSALDTVRWSPGDTYLATGNAAASGVATVYGGITDPIVFSNAVLSLGTSVNISCTWKFRGICKVVGQGSRLTFKRNNSAIVLAPGAKVMFDNVELFGLRDNNFQCMANNATVTLKNSKLVMSSDFTFSMGSFYIESDVLITGAKKFIYSSRVGSTIGARSTLYFDQETTFSYAPLRANKDLLYMPDTSAALYLDGATLFSTSTGLRLANGSLYLDNEVTMSTQARNSGEAMILSQSLDVNVFGLARMTQLVLPAMRKQKSGKIINISSIGGKIATPFGAWYHA
ncbi:MAG: SDR family NAD(P)-dependent oxidoreductase, partial [Neisseriaceae bacterium]|nr:SDR family NAD(P)-dependent oxidoreductase [Neisseriaceae bacterium]